MKKAVLLIVFNRPDTTTLVLNAIQEYAPTKLYISADAPRVGNKFDAENCAQVKNVINNINPNLNVIKNFQPRNLGCKYGVSEAIRWFLENEEEGIILEDDCLPNYEFFRFCDIMLDKYRENNEVAMITGFNRFGENVKSNEYYLSKFASIWGWATWRNKWNIYQVDINDRVLLENCVDNKLYPNQFLKYFDFSLGLVENGLIDTWDYQVQYMLIRHKMYCVTPMANLIRNIGPYGAHSHANYSNIFNDYGEIDLAKLTPLVDSELDIDPDRCYWSLYESLYKSSKYKRILHKLRLFRFAKIIKGYLHRIL